MKQLFNKNIICLLALCYASQVYSQEEVALPENERIVLAKSWKRKHLDSLVSDKSETVRLWVARNSKTSRYTLKLMSKKDVSEAVRRCASLHLEIIGNRTTHPREPQYFLKLDPPGTLAEVIPKRSLDERKDLSIYGKAETLSVLAFDKEVDVRIKVASNPRTPLLTLSKMVLVDQDDKVKEVANVYLKSGFVQIRELNDEATEKQGLVIGAAYISTYQKGVNKIVRKFINSPTDEVLIENYQQLKNKDPNFDKLQGVISGVFNQINYKIRHNRKLDETELSIVKQLRDLLIKVSKLDSMKYLVPEIKSRMASAYLGSDVTLFPEKQINSFLIESKAFYEDGIEKQEVLKNE